jgi:hypothetical protein
MEQPEKLTELIAVKLTKADADHLTRVAGGDERKRGAYLRKLIDEDRARAEAKTKNTHLCDLVAVELESNPILAKQLSAMLAKATRRRLGKKDAP